MTGCPLIIIIIIMCYENIPFACRHCKNGGIGTDVVPTNTVIIIIQIISPLGTSSEGEYSRDYILRELQGKI